MFEASFPVMAAWANAAIFALAGLINVTGLGAVREIYARWDIPAGFYRMLGIVELVAAGLLATPDLRIWGIILAGPILFGSVVVLLDHRHYLYAAPAILVLLALVPATLAAPQPLSPVRFATELHAPEASSSGIAAARANEPAVASVRESRK